jgi:hypothetical protein
MWGERTGFMLSRGREEMEVVERMEGVEGGVEWAEGVEGMDGEERQRTDSPWTKNDKPQQWTQQNKRKNVKLEYSYNNMLLVSN